jgi:hypothetical protein
MYADSIRPDSAIAGGAFGAQPAEIARVRLVAGHLDDSVVLDLHDDAATDATIRTHALYAAARHIPFPESKKRRPVLIR